MISSGAPWLERDRPAVSVVTCFWNTPREWILESCRSTLSQEGVDVELVLVDDGSDSPDLLDEIHADLELDGRVIPIGIEHGGVGRASNVGIGEASHELVARLDADDASLHGRLEAQARHLLAHLHVTVVSGGMEYVTASGEHVRYERPGPFTARASYDGQVPHGASMFRKSAWELVGGYPEKDRRGMDWHFLRKLEEAGARFSTLELLAIRRRLHEGSHSFADSSYLQKMLARHRRTS